MRKYERLTSPIKDNKRSSPLSGVGSVPNPGPEELHGVESAVFKGWQARFQLAFDTYYLVLESDFTNLSICLPPCGSGRLTMHLPRSGHRWREHSNPQETQLKLYSVHYHPQQS